MNLSNEKRIVHNLTQGSDEWINFRLAHCGASEAAAMLGLSSTAKRSELLFLKKTGIAKEFCDWVQKNILDYGHEVESLARSVIEIEIGDDLYPATYSYGMLSASCDGITITDEIAFEHKQYNQALFESVESGVLPDEYQPQCQQVLLVSGAKKLIFVCSDGTASLMAKMDVFPDQAWQQRIVDGWDQFLTDLKDYEKPEATVKIVAEPIKMLPALSIKILGGVSASNLPFFREAAEKYISEINENLTSDADFVEAEAAVKFLAEAEKKINAAKESALSQTAEIDDILKTLDHINQTMRTKRLFLNRLVDSRKAEIRAEIVTRAIDDLGSYLKDINSETFPVVVSVRGDFAGAIKGKRNFDSMQDAVSTELANCKISAAQTARVVKGNLKYLDSKGDIYKQLFSDLNQIGRESEAAFSAIVDSRIAKFEASKIKASEPETTEKTAASAEQIATPLDPAADIAKIHTSNGCGISDSEIVDAVASRFRISRKEAAAKIISCAKNLTKGNI
jgi:predicted phage-related endonuclease